MPMGACNSSIKNWGRAVVWRRFLNGLNYPCARRQTNLWPCCMPSFHSVCLLQYTNFVLQARNVVNKAMDWYVWKFAAGCYCTWIESEWSQLCTWAQWIYFWFTTPEFGMVGSCTKDLEEPQNCQNWRVDAFLGHTVTVTKIKAYT